MTLILEKSLSLSNIEKYYDIISQKKDALDIALPSEFNDGTFASKASLCQLLNTWVRKTNDNSSILIHVLNWQQHDESFSKDIFSLIVCLMTIKQGRIIYDQTGKLDITQEVFKKAIAKLEEARPRISNLDNEKYFGGKSGPIQVLCFDHSEVKKYQFNEWFYQDGKFLDEISIGKFYSAAIKHLLKPHKKNLEQQALMYETAEKVTGIVKELFENTDKHARKGSGSQSNISLNPNMRGVFMEVHKGSKENLISKTETGDPLFNYFNNPKLFSDNSKLKTFIEISVLDSGPGFAQRRSGRLLEELNLYTEREYVIECLTQYDTGAAKRGLKRVASYLGSKGGFLRLRTGRICLYWDFLLHGYKLSEHQSQYTEFQTAKSKFFDWERSDRGWTKMNEVSGSLITILYPLD